MQRGVGLVFAFFGPLMGADQEASGLLAKAREEMLRNREQQKHWIWTTATEHYVINKSGDVVERLPSVKTESLIRPDGRRCNAVLEWSDGVKPYLLDADAEKRCEVEQESNNVFQLAALLASQTVKIKSRTATTVTLEIQPDKRALGSSDPEVRCAASVRARVEIDLASSFPKLISGEVTETGCDQSNLHVATHYGDGPVLRARSGFHKGATFLYEYEFRSGKLAGQERHYWAATHVRSAFPMPNQVANVVYWGRKIPVMSYGPGLSQVAEARTLTTELGVESRIKFEPEGK
jgi:hypothetical protein